ncbi:hypothetical protein PtA15_1A727 [Puccinia triticina]|uniref:Uncharacterized protein n=1 Tax=Puccinia triticina TaxID=208348 RepID=A0ABY7CB49_9BASI|nr:uncharacterized protein PtA15_1A727 [Puccinia triticina]WAQ81386.1 hypothetical protein PtA15_1A727 [Puccinia triticina]
MDPSHNAWASLTSVPPTNCRTKTKSSTTANNSQAALIEKLARKIKTLKTNLNSKKYASKSKGKSLAKSAAQDSSPSSSSALAAKTKAPAPTTPKTNQQATSPPPPPEFMGPPKPRKSIPETPAAKPSPKRHPQQMQTGNFPAAFGPTKGGRIRYGKSIIHLRSNFVGYAQGILAQLGLSVWCPNLDKDSASLYNAAHQIAALTTLTELAATPAYAYLQINPVMAQDMPLLVCAYRHVIHYLQLKKYKKEMKETGKVAQEANNKKFNKNRKRLRDAHQDFAILNKYPQCYRDILEPILAHSDDKKVEGKGFYKIKTLPYRSNNTNCFFRQLDIVMIKVAEQDPLAKSSWCRVR